MIPDCQILKKNNITVISPKTNVTKVHKFEFDQIFYQDLVSSKKKICVYRNFNIQKNENHPDYLTQLVEFCNDFDIVFLEQEQEHFVSVALDPTKFIFITDNYRQSVLDFAKETTNTLEFIPFHWYRTSFNYSKVNKKLWSKNKKYHLTARMNAPRPWKVELLSKLYDYENLTWSALQAHDQIPGSPKIFESERSGSNHEMPSMEQIMSWSLLCLETNSENISEKSIQHLYHLSPTIWHTSKTILYFEQYGFTIKFNGFDYNYLEMPREQKIDSLVKQIRSMNADDFKDFFHQNIKETQNNHNIIKNIENWFQFFRPIILKYL